MMKKRRLSKSLSQLKILKSKPKILKLKPKNTKLMIKKLRKKKKNLKNLLNRRLSSRKSLKRPTLWIFHWEISTGGQSSWEKDLRMHLIHKRTMLINMDWNGIQRKVKVGLQTYQINISNAKIVMMKRILPIPWLRKRKNKRNND